MNAEQYLLIKSPKVAINYNYLALSENLVDENTISIDVNGFSVVQLFTNSTQETLEALKAQMLILPLVSKVVIASLMMGITINLQGQDITLSANVIGGATQATISIGAIEKSSRDAFLAYARQSTSSNWYNCSYEYAIALYAAHLMALRQNEIDGNNASGLLSSIKQGDLAIGYDNNTSNQAMNDSDLSRTSFGLELIQLRKVSNISMMTTGML